MIRAIAAGLILAIVGSAHEGHKKNPKPTKAEPDLKRSRVALDRAKRKLAAQGRYSCCVKPSCDLCARTTGSCNCAANVRAGKGACGECYGGWIAGRGALKGVHAKNLSLLTADHQGCATPADANGNEPSNDLKQAVDALLGAKRTLVAEKRYACCIRGGCGQCAHERSCPCGGDLAVEKKGVCGDCLDGWRSAKGAFEGIDPAEVKLAEAESAPNGMEASMASLYASGTSQIPGTTPMPMVGGTIAGWSMMVSANAFMVYSGQSGPRGRDKMFSTNWLMLMASRRAGPGTFTVHSMLSLEPLTLTSRRYPLLFATGETAYGAPIINGQHPHDFFMELAASYHLKLGERTSVHFYGGPRGEPALGPPAFPHRPSASENPVAVISHHQQDSTHIATNVVTLGITHRIVTWEVSGFHGREADEKRWGLETGAIDSLSTRLTLTPTPRWSAQVSIGRLNRLEATHPLRPALRSTASLMYVRPLASGSWATSLIWGRNNDLEYTQIPNLPALPSRATRVQPRHIVSVPTRIPRQIYNSYLAESTLRLRRNWIWGRAESADKDTTLLFEEAPFVLLIDEQRLARVQSFTAGYERELPLGLNFVSAGLGGQITAYRIPAMLAPIYGEHPLGAQLFLRVRLGSAVR